MSDTIHPEGRRSRSEHRPNTEINMRKILIAGAAMACLVSQARADLTLHNPSLECSWQSFDDVFKQKKHFFYIDIDLDKMIYREGVYKTPYPSDYNGTIVDFKASVSPGPTLVMYSANFVQNLVGAPAVGIFLQQDGTYVISRENAPVCTNRPGP
jgi:hypothetical protein